MAMPNVFVVPPEEEDSPPWCFFDARSDSDSDPPNDSDVIEVVRVGRRLDQGLSLRAFSDYRQSTTLKSRASKVFRSFKGSLRSSRPRLQNTVPSSLPSNESIHNQTLETVRRPRSPTVSRRGSRVLVQSFVAPTLESRPSMSSLDDSPSSVGTHALPSPPLSPPSDFITSASSHRSSLRSPMDQDQARMNASSPTPTTTSFKTTRRRFSMLSLQKLFSFSAAPPIPYDEFNHTMAASSPSATSSFSSISAPQTPTSTEEVNADLFAKEPDSTNLPMFNSFDPMFEANVGTALNLGVGLGLESGPSVGVQEATSRKHSFSNPWSFKRPLKSPSHSHIQEQVFHNDPGDTSLEMRLDSLHFDSLSFDADRF